MLPTLGAKSELTRRPVVLKVGKVGQSPYAYLQAGTIVDAKLKKDGIVRWYKAEIEEVFSTGEIDVVYLGADEEGETHRLNIREYIAPRVGETVEVEVDDEFEEGIILQTKGNDLYDIEVDGEVVEDISDESFRRQ
jgi:hypothetical protein